MDDRKTSRMAGKFFKTKICPWYNQGRCRLGADCNWAHAKQEVRDAVDLSKTKLCHAVADNGICTDPSCRFAHHREELRATTDVYKTSLCVFWMRGGCFIGNKCRYAHGLNELRYQRGPIPAKSPTVLVPHTPPWGSSPSRTARPPPADELSEIAKMGWNDLNEAAIAHALSMPRPSSTRRPRRAQNLCKAPRSQESNSVSPIGSLSLTAEELLLAVEALQSFLEPSVDSSSSLCSSGKVSPHKSEGFPSTTEAFATPSEEFQVYKKASDIRQEVLSTSRQQHGLRNPPSETLEEEDHPKAAVTLSVVSASTASTSAFHGRTWTQPTSSSGAMLDENAGLKSHWSYTDQSFPFSSRSVSNVSWRSSMMEDVISSLDEQPWDPFHDHRPLHHPYHNTSP